MPFRFSKILKLNTSDKLQTQTHTMHNIKNPTTHYRPLMAISNPSHNKKELLSMLMIKKKYWAIFGVKSYLIMHLKKLYTETLTKVYLIFYHLSYYIGFYFLSIFKSL